MKDKKYHEQWLGYFIIVNSGKSLLLVFSVIK
jgi:RNA polymerase subunit RPABC4/transcription elongation factor Spt4